VINGEESFKADHEKRVTFQETLFRPFAWNTEVLSYLDGR